MLVKAKILGCIAVLCGVWIMAAHSQEAAKPLHLRPLPMGQWLEEKAITLVLPNYDSGAPRNIFDGDTQSLLRSMDINPLPVYVEFDDAKSLRAVRVVISHHVGRWKLDGRLENDAPGAALHELIPWTDAGDGEASEVVLPATASVTALRLTVQRIGGDNYVHLNEWELLQEVVSENNTPANEPKN